MNRWATSLAINGPYLFVGTFGDGVFRTTDGTNWIDNSSGFKAQNGFIYINDLAVIQGFLFAAADDAVYRSDDNGQSWTIALPGIRSLCLSTRGQNIFAGSYGAFYFSNDLGSHWSRRPLAMDPSTAVTSLLAIGSTIFAGTTLDGIFCSTDGGTNWTTRNVGIPFSNGAVATIGSFTSRGGSLLAGTSAGIYFSNDTGQNWMPLNNGIPGFPVSTLLAVEDNVFAGTSGFGSHGSYLPGNGVYLLPDTSLTWLPVGILSPARPVDKLIVRGSDLYMVVEPDLYLSTLWKRPLSEMIAIEPESTIVATPPTKCLLYQNYPSPFDQSTTMEYDLPTQTHVLLELYNILGERIQTIVDETKQAGHYSSTLAAAKLPSGVFFCRLRASEFVQTRKLLLVR